MLQNAWRLPPPVVFPPARNAAEPAQSSSKKANMAKTFAENVSTRRATATRKTTKSALTAEKLGLYTGTGQGKIRYA